MRIDYKFLDYIKIQNMSQYGNYQPDFEIEPNFSFGDQFIHMNQTYVSFCPNSLIREGRDIDLKLFAIDQFSLSVQIRNHFRDCEIEISGYGILPMVYELMNSPIKDWAIISVRNFVMKIHGVEEDGSDPIESPFVKHYSQGPGGHVKIAIGFVTDSMIEGYQCRPNKK